MINYLQKISLPDNFKYPQKNYCIFCSKDLTVKTNQINPHIISKWKIGIKNGSGMLI